jgi:hypothetical protein
MHARSHHRPDERVSRVRRDADEGRAVKRYECRLCLDAVRAPELPIGWGEWSVPLPEWEGLAVVRVGKNVPVLICKECGTALYRVMDDKRHTADVLKEIRRTKRTAKRKAKEPTP